MKKQKVLTASLALCVALLSCKPLSAQQNYEPKYVKIKQVTASSTLKEKYSASNIANQNYESWAEGSAGDGCGEWVELTFSEPTAVDLITIKNGYGDLAWYWKNNRIKKATIIFDNDKSTKKTFSLPDTPEPQYLYIGLLNKEYSTMRLTIDEVYPGTLKDNDCCIDEICINATILRKDIYGAYYDAPDLLYVYDPETKLMFKGLYEIDVGKDKIREDEKGLLHVQKADWEDGDPYWAYVSASMRGTMVHGFWPGTGGGHESNQYKIYLNPNGRHLLFTWHEEFYGGLEYYDPLVTLYVWENKTWKKLSDWSEPGLKTVRALKEKLEKKNIKYYFDVYKESYSKDEYLVLRAYFKSEPYINVEFKFTQNNCNFNDYEKKIKTIAAFGTVHDFSSDSKLLEQLKKDSSKNSEPLIIASAFNPDPKMVEYLSSLGMSLEYKNPHNSKTYTALEAWNLGSNNDQVRDVLIKNGAVYSPKMLCDCIERDDKDGFKKFLTLVSDYKPVIEKLDQKIGFLKTESLIFYFSELNKLGIDLGPNPFSRALAQADIPLTKFFLSIGQKIPTGLEGVYGSPSPFEYHAKGYVEQCKASDDYRERKDSRAEKDCAEAAKKSREFLDYLFSLGVSPNDSESNCLYDISKKGRYISKYDLEMAKLFISKGADINKTGTKFISHPLYCFLEESGFDEKYWSPEQKQFKKLLLDNGAYAEYAFVCALYQGSRSSDIDIGKVFNEYFPKFTGKNVIFKHEHYPKMIEEMSLVVCLLEQHVKKESRNYMIKTLLDSGYTADGNPYYNKYYDPVEYYMIEICKGEFDDDSRYIINKMIEVRKEKTNTSAIMHSLIKNSVDLYFTNNNHLIDMLNILIENGAKWDYHDSYKEKTLNCAELLFEVKDWKFFNELIEERLDSLIATARLLIKNGAGSVLNEQAFKKAKVPAKIYKRILK